VIDWKPIETAPRDGSVVLLCGGKTSERFNGDDRLDKLLVLRPVTGLWLQQDSLLIEHGAFYLDAGGMYSYDNPTHWASLVLPCGRVYV
jgi:hypothetical protein